MSAAVHGGCAVDTIPEYKAIIDTSLSREDVMRYDIIINLDYENYSHEQLHGLFVEIQRAMQDVGFVMDGRRFTIDTPPDEAQALARTAIDGLEQSYQAQDATIIPMIREFFGFEPNNTINLLLPPTNEIHVEELADIDGLDVVHLFPQR
jgi:hypothetical protein